MGGAGLAVLIESECHPVPPRFEPAWLQLAGEGVVTRRGIRLRPDHTLPQPRRESDRAQLLNARFRNKQLQNQPRACLLVAVRRAKAQCKFARSPAPSSGLNL